MDSKIRIKKCHLPNITYVPCAMTLTSDSQPIFIFIVMTFLLLLVVRPFVHCYMAQNMGHGTYIRGNGSMNAGSNLGYAAKEPTIDLEVAGSGLVSCHFFIPFSFLPCVVH